MPYIKQSQRENYDEEIEKIVSRCPNEGDLNYIFTRLLLEVVGQVGESYAIYNKIIGVLECCKLEMYRRHIASYEESKIQSNGDVYASTGK